MFVLILTFTGVVWAAHFVRPLRVLSARLRSLTANEDEEADPTSQAVREVTTKTTKEFAELTVGIDRMLAELHERERAISVADDQRHDIVRRFLPPDIVIRLEAGERNLVERIPNATIVAIVINGLGELVDDGSAEDVRDSVDGVVSTFDALAAQNGLERIKIVGDTYYAACGLDRPRLDHSPRSIAFAKDVLGAMHDAQSRGIDLSVAVGIVSGPVDAGLAGSHRLLYDTWGSTVTQAGFLARAAAAGKILISESVVAQLPPDIDIAEQPVEDGMPHIWMVGNEPAASEVER
jgi:class 3 adenylate cyclase